MKENEHEKNEIYNFYEWIIVFFEIKNKTKF